MAVVAKSGVPSPSTLEWPASCQIGSGLICGEDLDEGDACFIKQSDGKVYKSGGSGVTALTDEGANIHGFAAEKCLSAQADAVTLLTDLTWRYGASLTAGDKVYLDVSAATKGRLNDAIGVAGLPPAGIIIDATRIRLFMAITLT